MAKLENNLTEGNVAKQLLIFALPFMFSNLIQTLYNVADMLIVGRFGDSAGISAVNIGGQVTLLVTNIIVGLTVGSTIAISQYLGSGDRKRVKESIGTLLIALLVASVVITIVMMLASDGILHLLNTPEEAYVQAREYLNITIGGTLFISGYNALAAIMRGLGDSKRPMIFVTVACITNIFLDLLLVGGFHMGARGAAIATVFSQAMSMCMCIVYLKRNDFIFDFKLRSFRFYKDSFAVQMRLGVPNAIQNVIVNTSFMVLTAIVNLIDVDASAAVGVVGKFNGFAILPSIAVGASVSAMCGQNFGAGKIERARKTMFVGLGLSMSFSVVIFIVAYLFPTQILRIFNDSPEMIAYGKDYMRTMTLDYLIVPVTFCVSGLVTGSGHTVISSISSIMSSLGFRIPLALLFGVVLDWGMTGLGLAAPIATAGTACFLLLYYFSGKWKQSTVIRNQYD